MARYELGIDVGKAEAIDIHVHVEIAGQGHCSLPDALNEASSVYFKAEDRHPTLEKIADTYRALNMAAVVFTVDARTQLGH